MGVLVKTLVVPKLVEAVQTTQYTAVNCRTIVDKFTATNTSAVNATLSVNLVESGGSPGASNLVVKSRAIAPNETYTFPELVGQNLDPGAFISTLAGSAASLTLRVSGREIT